MGLRDRTAEVTDGIGRDKVCTRAESFPGVSGAPSPVSHLTIMCSSGVIPGLGRVGDSLMTGCLARLSGEEL